MRGSFVASDSDSSGRGRRPEKMAQGRWGSETFFTRVLSIRYNGRGRPAGTSLRGQERGASE